MSISSKHKKLSDSAKIGWLWTGLEQFLQRGLGMVVSLILARLLEPEAFGMIASISIFIALAQQLINGGIAQRVIQKGDVQESDYNALFWCNFGMSSLMLIVLFLFSGIISDFFEEPELRGILRAMAIIIFIMNAGRVQEAKLHRALRFRNISLVYIFSSISGCAVGLVMAFKGWGVWSLLGQQASMALTRALGLFIVMPWKPSGLPCWDTVKDLYAFCLPIMCSQFIRAIADQTINVFIGKKYSVVNLGFYERGRLIPQNLGFSLQAILLRSNFPILSMLKEDGEGLRGMYLHLLGSACGIVILMYSGLLVYADEVVSILLGDKWLPSVWFLQVSCLSFFFYILYTMNMDLVRAIGDTRLIFRVNIVSSCVQVAGVILGGYWGIQGMVIGDLVGRFIGSFIMMLFVQCICPVSVGEQFKVLVKPAILACFMALVLLVFRNHVDAMWLRVSGGALIGGGCTFLYYSNLRRSY